MKRFAAAVCGLLFLSGYLSAQTASFITDSLDSYIRQGMKDWDVPGLAIVIVKDGKIVTMKGYGVRDISTKDPVNENTLFMIASNTKLFTGTALANLEFQNRLSLNDRFTKYFPSYTLYDPQSTALLTIRDLLSHRIGTRTFQGDFTFWNSSLSRKQIMDKMRMLKPVNSFRQEFGYCNSCFMAAGLVVSKVTGIPWEKYIQDSILSRLQMNRSFSISSGMEDRENAARPYTTAFSGQLKRVPYDQWDNLGPAASIVSCVNDLSHWLFFQLDSGKYNGSQIIPFAVIQKTRDVNTIVSSRRSRLLPMHFQNYGLGIFTGDYNGRQIYWHTGGAGGMVSNVCFVPEEKLGIAILTNNDNQDLYEALRYQILDAYLGVPYVNRSKQALQHFQPEMNGQLQNIAAWNQRVKGKAAPLPLSDYTGEYDNDLYGSMTITQKENHLQLKFNGHAQLTARLDYMDNDEWLLRYDNIEYGIFATKFRSGSHNPLSIDIRANEFVEFDHYIFTKK
ncbi:MAG: serine hydrolase [Chitinophagaceae bacterium]|nr:serine hydrolase [Chitinophagaceae bacterium]